MKARRRQPWLINRTSLLLERNVQHSVVLPAEMARDLFDHRDTTAGLMRIGGQAPQFYVTAEVISKTADQIVLKKLDSRVGNELVCCG